MESGSDNGNGGEGVGAGGASGFAALVLLPFSDMICRSLFQLSQISLTMEDCIDPLDEVVLRFHLPALLYSLVAAFVDIHNSQQRNAELECNEHANVAETGSAVSTGVETSSTCAGTGEKMIKSESTAGLGGIRTSCINTGASACTTTGSTNTAVLSTDRHGTASRLGQESQNQVVIPDPRRIVANVFKITAGCGYHIEVESTSSSGGDSSSCFRRSPNLLSDFLVSIASQLINLKVADLYIKDEMEEKPLTKQ
mmetsp:Transcript_6020/g.9968  ORF Transcript_6020/g.9968 Transcript_6020/m.9968 type:complete len:254 (-) Transcript_6020:1204-1965(-)